MRRRRFLRTFSTAVLGGGFLNRSRAREDAAAKELDRFGGWKGKQFEATGFFRVEKDHRWWLVTPEGNAFLSFGINHLHTNLWKQPYNRETWQERLGLTELKGPEFHRALRSWFIRERGAYGFNTLGVHTSLPALNTPEPFMPYMRPIHFVDIPHWKDEIPDTSFVDVFSQSFELRCDRLAREFAEPTRTDPFLLGYAMTDCPLFTEEDCRERPDVVGGARRAARIGWPRRLRNLGADTPGKKAYVETMRDLYRGQASDFNATYGTQFESFGDIAQARDWRRHTDLSNGNETRDNVEFLKRGV
ncbi:MAG: hypothetical protein ABGZ17_29760, partial [Planctomycetaceae bacterium]